MFWAGPKSPHLLASKLASDIWDFVPWYLHVSHKFIF